MVWSSGDHAVVPLLQLGVLSYEVGVALSALTVLLPQLGVARLELPVLVKQPLDMRGIDSHPPLHLRGVLKVQQHVAVRSCGVVPESRCQPWGR